MTFTKYFLISILSLLLLIQGNANASTQEDRALATIEILKERKDAEDRANINAYKREMSGGISSRSINESFLLFICVGILFAFFALARHFYDKWKDTPSISEIRDAYEKLKAIYAESSADNEKVSEYKRHELELIRKRYEGAANGQKNNISKAKLPIVIEANKSLLKRFIDDDKIQRHESLRLEVNRISFCNEISWDEQQSLIQKLLDSYD